MHLLRRRQGRRGLLIALALVSGHAWIASPQHCSADLVWKDHYADGDSIVNGSSITTSDGTTITFDRTVFSDNTGGTFDLDPYSNSDYITFQKGPLGGVKNHLEFSFDNQNNDPDDYVELALNFDRTVTHLQFSLLDIDSGTWDDGVEVYYNGSQNARDNPAIATSLGAYVGLDNESYMHGWEGLGRNAGNGQTAGNIDFDFGSLQITSLRIRYFSTDDANNNPGGQVVGLSDLSFTEAVPEPSSLACMCVFGALLLLLGGRQGLTKKRRPTTPDGHPVKDAPAVDTAGFEPTVTATSRSWVVTSRKTGTAHWKRAAA